MPAKQKLSQRKALRSAAAKKGWQTRRALSEAMERHREARNAAMRPFMAFAYEPTPPDPTPAKQNWLHRLWSKLVGR